MKQRNLFPSYERYMCGGSRLKVQENITYITSTKKVKPHPQIKMT